MPADLKKIYRALDPAPLSGADSDLYVPLDDVRGSSGLVRELTTKIRISDRPTFQLLAGHIGSGKSTELRRIQQELQTGDDRYFTVFCQVLEDIDPSDADFPDVLMAIMRQVARELRERLKIQLKPGYLRKRLQEIKTLLGTDINFESLELEAGLAKVTAAIKSSPTTREQIRKALEPTTDSLIEAANDILGQAVAQAAKKGYAGIAVIADDLDKLSVLHQPELGGSVAERLFLTRHAQLTAFRCPVVCTIPISLAYSCKEQEMANLYGMTAPPVVPMTKIFEHDGKRHASGFEKFREIIARRLGQASVQEGEVFAGKAVKDKIIEYSGGQPRVLITLIRDSLVEGDLPLNRATIDRVAKKVTHSYARQLREEHWTIIEQVRKTHMLKRTTDNDSLCMDLLANRAILQYPNDPEWYGLNPLLPTKQTRK